MVHIIIALILTTALSACRASFRNIKTDPIAESTDLLESPKETIEPEILEKKAFKELTKTYDLPREESRAHGCEGILRVFEKGLDKNRDEILQPSEVLEVRTQCIPDQAGPQQNCPEQNGGCARPSQNSPIQGR